LYCTTLPCATRAMLRFWNSTRLPRRRYPEEFTFVGPAEDPVSGHPILLN
jgi:hypothetical protein